MPQLLFSVTLKQSLTLSHLPGMHIGNLFRNKELISMLLPQFLIVGSKHCEIHELSTFLWNVCELLNLRTFFLVST